MASIQVERYFYSLRYNTSYVTVHLHAKFGCDKSNGLDANSSQKDTKATQRPTDRYMHNCQIQSRSRSIIISDFVKHSQGNDPIIVTQSPVAYVM